MAADHFDCRSPGRPATLSPWEAEPSWHPARREAFLIYRDLPARSYPQVARKLSKSTTLIKRWASEDGWQDRVRAWDTQSDLRRREEFHGAGAEVARRQATDAAELRNALVVPARAIKERIERLQAAGDDPFESVSLPELIRLTATAARALSQVAQVERLAHGLPNESVVAHHSGLARLDVERMSSDQLTAYLTDRDETGSSTASVVES